MRRWCSPPRRRLAKSSPFQEKLTLTGFCLKVIPKLGLSMHARHPQAGRKPHNHPLVLSFAYRTHARTFAIPRLAAIIVFLLIPIAAVLYLAATCYLIFHDDVLAGLMQRQASLQYAYENRIAALQRDVENANQRAANDAAGFAERLRGLSQRQALIESRTALLATFAAEVRQMRRPAADTDLSGETRDPMPTAAVSSAPADAPTPNPPRDGKPHPAGFDLRLEDGNHPTVLPFSTSDAEPQRDDSGQSPDGQAQDLAARYAQTDAADLALLASFERPADRLTRQVDETLATIGLSPNRFRTIAHAAHRHAADGVGGPFVPLPALADGSAFARAATHLQNALATATDVAAILPHIPLKAPLRGKLEVTSPFGPRLDPFFGRPALHTGVDLHGAFGDCVRATAPGRVTFAGAMGGYGNLVEIDSGNGLATRYAHLSSIDVVQGQSVAAGTIVGHIGETGRATGPHLHYEVRIDGEPVDPERFLRAGQTLAADLAL
jgi:murein DD-endopeptidase MepM/ murein hydrolase activator NlpD